jgi:hypothetical protein
MTLGGNDITKTPLYDNDFTNAPNTSGNTHYYLMYALSSTNTGTEQGNVSQLLPAQIPQQFQRYKLITAPPPSKFMALEKPGPAMQITSTLLAGGNAKVERVPQTGALRLDSGQLAAPSVKVLMEKEYTQRAESFLNEQGLAEQQTAEPVVTRYMTASMPVNGQSSELQQAQAGVSVVYKRVIPVNGVPFEVLGTAGTIRVQLNNDGAVLKASKLWHTLEPVGSPVAAKTFDQARDEAMKKLGTPDSYKLNLWKLGYKQESVEEGQDELAPVYQFAFVPVKAHDIEHPPQLIEVSALKQ